MKKLFTFIQIILIVIIIISSVKIYNYSLNLKETDEVENISRNMWQDLIESNIDNYTNIVIKETKESKLQDTLEFLANLKAEYPDTVAYINIDDTTISYPVVQADDNIFYLNRSPSKEHNPNGSVFMSYLNNSDFSDDNTVLYGHNVRSGKLFQNLHKFKDQEFYDEVNTIQLQTSVGSKTYKIISVYKTNPNYQYKTPNYSELKEKNVFINEILDKSLVNTDYPDYLFSNDSKLLTLSTCEVGGKDRLVVHGVEITD